MDLKYLTNFSTTASMTTPSSYLASAAIMTGVFASVPKEAIRPPSSECQIL
jgi:hypothetical protein